MIFNLEVDFLKINFKGGFNQIDWKSRFSWNSKKSCGEKKFHFIDKSEETLLLGGKSEKMSLFGENLEESEQNSSGNSGKRLNFLRKIQKKFLN